jgi:hypothetical protein
VRICFLFSAPSLQGETGSAVSVEQIMKPIVLVLISAMPAIPAASQTPAQQFGGQLPPIKEDSSGTDPFAAVQEQLGLKLEAPKGPAEVLVIDSVQFGQLR